MFTLSGSPLNIVIVLETRSPSLISSVSGFNIVADQYSTVCTEEVQTAPAWFKQLTVLQMLCSPVLVL